MTSEAPLGEFYYHADFCEYCLSRSIACNMRANQASPCGNRSDTLPAYKLCPIGKQHLWILSVNPNGVTVFFRVEDSQILIMDFA